MRGLPFRGPPQRPQRRRTFRISISSAAALMALLVAAGFTTRGELNDCLLREAVGYRHLELMAKSVLDAVDFELLRAGACQDTGRPWTRLEAHVGEWPHRKVAKRYFIRRGWSEGPGGLVSPDGSYRVETSTARAGDGSDQSYVTVTFSEVADQAQWAGGQGSEE